MTEDELRNIQVRAEGRLVRSGRFTHEVGGQPATIGETLRLIAEIRRLRDAVKNAQTTG